MIWILFVSMIFGLITGLLCFAHSEAENKTAKSLCLLMIVITTIVYIEFRQTLPTPTPQPKPTKQVIL